MIRELYQVFNRSVVCLFQEMWVQGFILTAGILAYPFYAMFEVAGHKRAEFAEFEIPEEWEAWKASKGK